MPDNNKPGQSYDALPASWTIAGIITEIAERAGIPAGKIDVSSLLTTYADGFSMTNAYAAYTGIEALGRIFLFDPSNYDGVLHFVPRGGASAATLTVDGLIDDGKDIHTRIRRDAMSVPRVMHLQYYAYDGGLDPDKQSSERSVDARATSEVTTESTVIMRPLDAARTTAINHKISMEEQRGGMEFSLPDSYLKLVPGDIVLLDGERARIISVEVEEGLQNYKSVFDRASAVTSAVIGIPTGIPTPPPSLIVGTTVLHFIDSHILRDQDDRLGFYVAISGAEDAWTGALVEISYDGGANYVDSVEATTDAEMGALTTALATHPAEYPDDINSCSVQMLRTDMELESTDLAGMQNRVNLAIIDDELINYGTVSETSPGVWLLSYFLRGRKGSAVAAHGAGARFVSLDRTQLWFIDTTPLRIGQPFTFRATSFGSATQTIVTTANYVGRSQLERQPAYLAVTRDGLGNIVITWQGVGRLGGGMFVGMGSYFTGFIVSVNGTDQPITTAETMTVVDPGAGATISVRQINSLTGAGPTLTVTI